MLYIIRHAESKANAQGIYQGQTYDTDLTARGKKQATALGKAVKAFKIERIITSPLKRCMETAEIIDYSNNRTIEQNKLLVEINHGTWEGKRVEEFNKKELEVLKVWKENPEKAQMIKGENFAEVINRCRKFLKSIEAHKSDYLIVTHDTITRVFVTLIRGRSFQDFWKLEIDNCGISKFGLDNRLIYLNKVEHLNGIRAKLGKQAL